MGPEDPAENPVRMARLETLLDMLILDTDSLSDEDRRIRYRKPLSTPGRHHRVTVWAGPRSTTTGTG